MFAFAPHRRSRAPLVIAIAAAGLCIAARAQDSSALRELRALHDELNKPGLILTAEQGEAALVKLDKWEPLPAGTSNDRLAMADRLRLLASLAVGDAASADQALVELRKHDSRATDLTELEVTVALALGDAPRAMELVKKLKDTARSKDEKTWSLHERRLRRVGAEAPAETVTADNGTAFPLRERNGRVLVLDFWNMQKKPTDTQVGAVRKLQESLKAEAVVEFLGVCAPGGGTPDEMKRFASSKGYAWPQVYERSGESTLSSKAFAAGPPLWNVLIDRGGMVRAVGAADEAAFVYAVRAAVAERNGKYEYVAPVALEKSSKPKKSDEPKISAKPEAEKGKSKPESKPEAKPQPKEPPGKGDLPSSPEAEALLKQARVYLKTGKKTDAKKLLNEIIQKYPGTREAREAEEILRYL